MVLSLLPLESFHKRGRRIFVLTDVSIASGIKVIKEPSLDDNTFIYTVNDVAQRSIDYWTRRLESKTDTRIRIKQTTLTIAEVQPRFMMNRQSGQPLQSLSDNNYSKLATS